MEKPNCKKCRYRIAIARMVDMHVWEEDCDKYGTDFCEKMNNPEFIKCMDVRGEEDGKK